MKPNFWLYRTKAEQNNMAGSLVAFGAEVAMKANVIQNLDYLQECNKALQTKQDYDTNAVGLHFGLEYLIDSVRILIFFENYMKAELIVKNFCVHSIDKADKNRTDLLRLARKQEIEPILLADIRDIEPFVGDDSTQTLYNPVIKETTIGLNVLLRPRYLVHYAFDDNILRTLKDLVVLRNKLHFHSEIEFKLSNEFIEDMLSIRNFISGMAISLTQRKPTAN